jgi:hypothetical protein
MVLSAICRLTDQQRFRSDEPASRDSFSENKQGHDFSRKKQRNFFGQQRIDDVRACA